jgi:hypothetical protein
MPTPKRKLLTNRGVAWRQHSSVSAADAHQDDALDAPVTAFLTSSARVFQVGWG